jgi:lipopolysaccharide export system ATP-binding protein
MPTLRAEHLVKTYKGRTVVNDVSIYIEPGEIVGLLGPNGAGKTTSFYMMVGLVKPEKGRVLLDSEDITRLPMFRRAHQGIGYLAQENSVFRKLTAAENIMLILEMQPKLSRAQRRERCDSLIESLDLTTVRNNIAQTLSGGERRRVEIARVLATDPKFILLDEPFTGVDPIQKEELSRLIGTLKQRQIGVLITDHDVLFTLAITDRAYILSEGEVKTSGTTSEIVDDPLAQKYYLGETITSRLKTSTMGYVCATCGGICSAEEARADHFVHSADGGTLVPISNNSQTRGLAKSETA